MCVASENGNLKCFFKTHRNLPNMFLSTFFITLITLHPQRGALKLAGEKERTQPTFIILNSPIFLKAISLILPLMTRKTRERITFTSLLTTPHLSPLLSFQALNHRMPQKQESLHEILRESILGIVRYSMNLFKR